MEVLERVGGFLGEIRYSDEENVGRGGGTQKDDDRQDDGRLLFCFLRGARWKSENSSSLSPLANDFRLPELPDPEARVDFVPPCTLSHLYTPLGGMEFVSAFCSS